MKQLSIILISVLFISCGTLPGKTQTGGTKNKNNQKNTQTQAKTNTTDVQPTTPSTAQKPNVGISDTNVIVKTDNFSNKDGMTFTDGFESGLQTNWENLSPLVSAKNKSNWQIDTKVKRYGSSSLRIEVKPGDQSKNEKSERTELVGMKNKDGSPVEEDLNSGTKFYALSILIPTDWVPLHDTRGGVKVHGTFLQLHGNGDIGGGVRPMIGLNVTDRFYVMHHNGDADKQSFDHDLEDYTYEFSNGKLNPGHWVDFVLKIKYAATNTGEIVVWRRDEGKKDFTQVLDIPNTGTLFYQGNTKNVLPHKWHCGLYRSNQSDVTNVLWLDCITRANSFESAVTNAFGK